MNKEIFKGLMLLNQDTPEKIADALNISRTTLSSKLNEYRGAEFTQGEIMVVKNRWKLSPEQLDSVFFAK